MENKLKHLEFIQNVINRMANTSFLLKGWSITIIAGLFAFSATEGLVAVLWLGVLLTLVFCVLVLGLVFPLAGAALQSPV